MAEMDGGPSLSARTTTFQRMLELEKRYKLDRLQTSQLLNAAPATPFLVDNQDRHSLQSRRADSLQTQRQYNDAMVKAVRRSLVPPSLSITIPQRQSDRPRDFDRKQDISAVTEQGSLDQVPVVESLHKQVKFLAPNDEDEDVSDQSSICQSPSWEGYNVKKKEKKLEAERKRRDKEIAVREAKEAKKKLAARLSKTPPSVRRASTALALTITERSSSDPTLPNTSSTTAVPRVAAPVSILKQRAPRSPSPPELSAAASASRVPVLSALPKHMQLQAGMAARPAALTEAHCGVGAPMTKVLVECCSCRFYHDMPSKVYECMLNPDAVVQDHSLGISGAITTRVRCPWCQHEMSTQCCAGYAAVVYLEQKLH
ncbi:hypothetical protein P8C59_002894 [Phyllachora maydis]|uniref:Uncharacterized protein n=1 Tax=Phyllachora maydis TaxID=1825666 RepID=A0AAD9I0Q8_9PEZI|nr:hypothetical protein P8C59_002894 [Phyllachora maydis]